MSFAEIILRVGASIGGWLIFIGLGLTLAVVPQADCNPSSDELWRGTLLFALLGAVGLFFVGRGLQWRDAIRWFAIPATGLAVYAGIAIFPALIATSLNGESLCVIANSTVPIPSGFQASTVERAWPVVQLVVLAAGIVQGIRYWQTPSNSVDAA